MKVSIVSPMMLICFTSLVTAHILDPMISLLRQELDLQMRKDPIYLELLADVKLLKVLQGHVPILTESRRKSSFSYSDLKHGFHDNVPAVGFLLANRESQRTFDSNRLFRLPNELFQMITSYLPWTDRIRLSLTDPEFSSRLYLESQYPCDKLRPVLFYCAVTRSDNTTACQRVFEIALNHCSNIFHFKGEGNDASAWWSETIHYARMNHLRDWEKTVWLNWKERVTLYLLEKDDVALWLILGATSFVSLLFEWGYESVLQSSHLNLLLATDDELNFLLPFWRVLQPEKAVSSMFSQSSLSRNPLTPPPSPTHSESFSTSLNDLDLMIEFHLLKHFKVDRDFFLILYQQLQDAHSYTVHSSLYLLPVMLSFRNQVFYLSQLHRMAIRTLNRDLSPRSVPFLNMGHGLGLAVALIQDYSEVMQFYVPTPWRWMETMDSQCKLNALCEALSCSNLDTLKCYFNCEKQEKPSMFVCQTIATLLSKQTSNIAIDMVEWIHQQQEENALIWMRYWLEAVMVSKEFLPSHLIWFRRLLQPPIWHSSLSRSVLFHLFHLVKYSLSHRASSYLKVINEEIMKRNDAVSNCMDREMKLFTEAKKSLEWLKFLKTHLKQKEWPLTVNYLKN